MNNENKNIACSGLTRRGLLKSTAGAMAGAIGLSLSTSQADDSKAVTKGRIKQSVCEWCFRPMTLETLARNAAAMGIKSVELLEPKDWPVLKKYGLICAMTPSHGFVKGFNRKENHAMCIDKVKTAVDATAAAGFPNVITFSGFREGMPDDVGLENTVKGIKKVIGYVEKKGVDLCIEMLNSRVAVEMKGHPGYMGDKMEWCIEVCRRVGSPRMKVLFDIYHVQIMQGDVITRIKQFKDYIGHYHVAGVPGRNEMDDNQEINFPPIMRTIVETGYTGYVGQEFIPTRDPMTSLRQAVKLCDV